MADGEAERERPRDRRRPWSWGDSLGGVRPDDGRTYLIRRIVFDLVKNRCSELGLEEGGTLRCRSRDRERIVVELTSGAVRSLDLTYARFVEVEPVAGTPDLGLRA